MISEETKRKIYENNLEISKLLDENEKLYLSGLNDYNRRVTSLAQDYSIQIPNGYVRTKDFFIKKYKLKNLTKSYQHQSNIAYLMQYNDLNQYFCSRFNVFGQLKNTHYFYEIVNLVSILEVILKELAQQYRDQCANCSNKNKCPYLISKKYINDLKELLNRLNELNIIQLNTNEIETLNELINLRNNIHLRLMDDTLYNSKLYNATSYSRYMKTFQNLINSINIKALECLCI